MLTKTFLIALYKCNLVALCSSLLFHWLMNCKQYLQSEASESLFEVAAIQ